MPRVSRDPAWLVNLVDGRTVNVSEIPASTVKNGKSIEELAAEARKRQNSQNNSIKKE